MRSLLTALVLLFSFCSLTYARSDITNPADVSGALDSSTIRYDQIQAPNKNWGIPFAGYTNIWTSTATSGNFFTLQTTDASAVPLHFDSPDTATVFSLPSAYGLDTHLNYTINLGGGGDDNTEGGTVTFDMNDFDFIFDSGGNEMIFDVGAVPIGGESAIEYRYDQGSSFGIIGIRIPMRGFSVGGETGFSVYEYTPSSLAQSLVFENLTSGGLPRGDIEFRTNEGHFIFKPGTTGHKNQSGNTQFTGGLILNSFDQPISGSRTVGNLAGGIFTTPTNSGAGTVTNLEAVLGIGNARFTEKVGIGTTDLSAVAFSADAHLFVDGAIEGKGWKGTANQNSGINFSTFTNIWTSTGGGTARFFAIDTPTVDTTWTKDGKVGIGTTAPGSAYLAVNGGITDIGQGTYTKADGDNDLGADGDIEANGIVLATSCNEENAYFSGYDNTGGTDVTSGAVVTIDTTTVSDSKYSLSSGTVTVGTTGLYRIQADCGTDISSGSARSISECSVQVNGSTTAGSTCFLYNRLDTAGEGSCSVEIVKSLTASDTVRIFITRITGTDTIVTVAERSRLNLEFLR